MIGNPVGRTNTIRTARHGIDGAGDRDILRNKSVLLVPNYRIIELIMTS